MPFESTHLSESELIISLITKIINFVTKNSPNPIHLSKEEVSIQKHHINSNKSKGSDGKSQLDPKVSRGRQQHQYGQPTTKKHTLRSNLLIL